MGLIAFVVFLYFESVMFFILLEDVRSFRRKIKNKIGDITESQLVDREKVNFLLEKNKEISEQLGIEPPLLSLGTDLTKTNATAFKVFKWSNIEFELRTINELSNKALASVLAHELFHIKKNHWLKVFVIKKTLKLGLIGSIISLMWKLDSQVNQSFSNLIAFSLLGYVLFMYGSLLITGLVNLINRKHEYDCDHFSYLSTGIGGFLNQADYFRKQTKKDFCSLKSTNYNHVLLNECKWLFLTHPSWDDRISHIIKKSGIDKL